VFISCGFKLKFFPFASGSFMQEGSDVQMGQNLFYNEAITGSWGSRRDVFLMSLDMDGSLNHSCVQNTTN